MLRKISHLAKDVDNALFPALQFVCLMFRNSWGQGEFHELEGVRLLTTAGVSCHLAIPPDPPFTDRFCVCQNNMYTSENQDNLNVAPTGSSQC